ncbi:phosphoglycerate mutase family protein [Penicillium capsulatum]|uniref:Phosphoglycerate mutase family protein n=1 Tax=Penicillium capsulatum TaxID=69766 RepID=A0A9W9ILH2_9EURO|nr:phosphoglycerate mutase family protein [Penicillium capsulatum]KAJ6122915.1 phosphoglycerate mutase family protein [Penicillium capsulatum]
MLKFVWSILTLVAVAFASPTVYFIRHGEKPRHGGTGLSADGLERAQCVRDVFASHSEYDIGYILAQRPKSNGKRARPYDTVKRLATDLGLEVDIHCDRDDAWCVRKSIERFKGPGNILICWEHHRMTHLVEELGNDDAPTYPDDRQVFRDTVHVPGLTSNFSRFDLIWTNPSPYTEITSITSEKCPGLDRLGMEHVDAIGRTDLKV